MKKQEYMSKPNLIDNSLSRSQLFERNVALVTIFLPLIIVISTTYFFWRQAIKPIDISLFLGMYLFTMIGLTMGFHRLFTHRSFECKSWIKVILAIAGSMSAQGPLYFWVACHRRHHKSSDKLDDPHSPHHHNGNFISLLKSCHHAHLGWMINNKPQNYIRLVPDLLRDKTIFKISRFYFLWVFLGLLLPALIGGLFSFTWIGVFSGLFWGGFVRMIFVHHLTWSINSICHLFGSQDYKTDDESKNNIICGILALGEGWHNNHHAFQTSAQHGLKWWQIDITYQFIRLASIFHLVWSVKVPAQENLKQKTIINREARVS